MLKHIYMCMFVLCDSVFKTVDGQKQCASVPGHAVQFGNKCIWTVSVGNMSNAIEGCQSLGGVMFSFDNVTDASRMLEITNISQETKVLIGAVMNEINGSDYYDWLSRPDTWSRDMDSLITPTLAADTDVKYKCLVLHRERLVPVSCDTSFSVTLCENVNTEACLCGNNTKNDTIRETVSANARTSAAEQHHNVETSIPSSISHDPPKNASDRLQRTYTTSTNALYVDFSEDHHIQNDTETNATESTTAGFELSELQIVPGPDGSSQLKNMSSILNHVINHVISSINTTEATTSKPLSNELVPVTINNKSELISFAGLLDLIVNRSTIANSTDGNESKETNNKNTGSLPTFISALFPRNHTFHVGYNDTSRVPVTEVKFQISGLGPGSARPKSYTDMNTLFSYGHLSTGHPTCKNISETLLDLQLKPHVDKIDLQMFTTAITQAVENNHIQVETVSVKRNLFMDFLMVAERLVNNIGDPTADLQIETDAIEIMSTVVTSSSTNSSHVDIPRCSSDTRIRLSTSIFNNSVYTGVRVSTILYKKTGPLVEAMGSHVSSTVMSVSVQYIQDDKTHELKINTEEAVIFTMDTFLEEKQVENNRFCAFLDFTTKTWSTAGCHVIAKNSSHTTCECNHLTNFAILVMYVETEEVSLRNQQVLFTMTTVGCSLSIACLAMTLITYVYLRMLGREKIMIHANLSLALLLGQLVFVSSSDAYKNTSICKAIAIILHFLFMSSFSWMMVEGVALYLCCTRGIFNQRDMRVKYFLLGWGPPALIVVVSVAVEFPDYGNGPQYSCWLSVNNGLIWAFVGPMLVILSMNMLVMGLVVKVFLTLKTNTQKTEVARFRGSVRAMLTLLPLLGLTWISSLLVPYGTVFHYLFVIINTVQGMCIFFFHCICNDEIRQRFREKTRKWSSSRTGSEQDVSNHQRRKAGSFDTIKAKTASPQSPSSSNSELGKLGKQFGS